MSVEDLKHVLTPSPDPVATGADANWKEIEAELGTSLPLDYKEFVSQYGVGCIDDFLWVLNPFTTNDNLNLVSQVPVTLDAMRQLRDAFGTELPHPLFPDEGGLFPWAFTDNGDVLYLRFANGTVESPVVVGDSGGMDWEEFDGTVTDCLTALLTRRYRVDFFPDEFPSGNPTFAVHE